MFEAMKQTLKNKGYLFQLEDYDLVAIQKCFKSLFTKK